ncbi:hypothetical protein [Nonomuraea sp. bgisy101]|uniref:hypothetical protein n=1 Tax=Nonomuraea sp. bgisy101 TaxID=3413784 RepID=UPI003D738F3D
MNPADIAWIFYLLGAAATIPTLIKEIEAQEAKDPLQMCDTCRDRMRHHRTLVEFWDDLGIRTFMGALMIFGSALTWPITLPRRAINKARRQQHICHRETPPASRTPDQPNGHPMTSIRDLAAQTRLPDYTPIASALPGLTWHVRNPLADGGITTIGHLAQQTDDDLRALPGLGQHRLDAIRTELERMAREQG